MNIKKVCSIASAFLFVALIAYAAPVPPALGNAGEYGENIYDFAKLNSWTKATARFKALQTVEKQLPPKTDQLDTVTSALEKALTSKDRIEAMRQANQ